MKKMSKKGLIIISVIIICLLIMVVSYTIPRIAMDPVNTGKIPDTNIYAVNNNKSVVYFIKTDNGYIMIDAGVSKNFIEKSINDAGMKAEDIKWILLTHSDSDHVASLELFPNAEIYMNKDEFSLINGNVNRMLFIKNSLPREININKILLLSDNQELFLEGTKIKCISTPGHTIGSMMYLVDDKYLFTGDAFKIKKGKMSVHISSMDSNQSKKTIERINDIVDNTFMILPSHYKIVKK